MKSWTPEEDKILRKLYQEVPNFRKWKNITVELEKLGIKKTQYECRERYINKLDPQVLNSEWSSDELKKIFTLYNQYGSQWSLIQKCLPGRTQNSIKNKFYCTIRNFLRALFRCESKSNSRSLVQMSSKKLTDLYEGKKEFRKFKGFVKKIIKSLDYKITQAKLEQIANQDPKKIGELYQLIFNQKCNQRDAQLKKIGNFQNQQTGFKKYVPQEEMPNIVISVSQKRNCYQQQVQKSRLVFDPLNNLVPPSFFTNDGFNSSSSLGSSYQDEDVYQNEISPQIDYQDKDIRENNGINAQKIGELMQNDWNLITLFLLSRFGMNNMPNTNS